ncbi:diacylglycerol kinase [Xenorhabdus cabanillasii]|uniref:Diacylglycerol kinase n=2 Tax=Xenorhabdus cabanillasii TaxID=351673 RepID=A0A3D9U9Z9_9GAMM|nr:diacylglycerol kinase [Xenorhabdus cabanillasii]PHM76139.1 diacylglycerol kinase [Xenorhabdus cabanillasii JM26]REF26298.1 diacylglycerol kinase [Xenorhabdus cabanillasii]CDL79708.1 Diacylglycerol kinase [Xenorhabdus cabanillasii JM26]
MANQSTGLSRIIKAARYSAKGIKAAWQNEAAFRQEVILAILAVIVAFSFDFGMLERLFLISSVILVVIVEVLNSAIEAVVDRIGSEYHALSGRAKDMGSAAVFLAVILALFIWVTIIGSYFIR